MVVHLIALHEHGFKGPKFIIKLHFIIPNIRSNKRIGPHNFDMNELLFGFLLGNGNAERLMNGRVKFRFK